jgi:hypothetical protein
MAYQLMGTGLRDGGLVLLAISLLTLSGCSGSSSSQSDSSGTTVRVVFPNQAAALWNHLLPGTGGVEDARSKAMFDNIFADLGRLFEVAPAYAQAVPANVARLVLTVTGPGIMTLICARD